jgi:hypothetical protein
LGIEVYLAVAEDPALWSTTESVLVLYLQEQERPPERLVDPTIVGIGPAEGVWDLLVWHVPTRRAFYEEIRAVTDEQPVL